MEYRSWILGLELDIRVNHYAKYDIISPNTKS